MARVWTPLRMLVLVGAGVGVLFWIGSIVCWWRIPASRRDGLELIGPIVATAYLIGLVLPTLVLGLLGRWLATAALLAVLVLALASDTLWPWLPWPR